MGKRRTDEIHDDLKGVSGIYRLYRSAGQVNPIRIGQTQCFDTRMGHHFAGGYDYFAFSRCALSELDKLEREAWHRYGGEEGRLHGNHPPTEKSGCHVAGCRLSNRVRAVSGPSRKGPRGARLCGYLKDDGGRCQSWPAEGSLRCAWHFGRHRG